MNWRLFWILPAVFACLVLEAVIYLARNGWPKVPKPPKGMRTIVTGGGPVLVTEAEYQARQALHLEVNAKCAKVNPAGEPRV